MMSTLRAYIWVLITLVLGLSASSLVVWTLHEKNTAQMREDFDRLAHENFYQSRLSSRGIMTLLLILTVIF